MLNVQRAKHCRRNTPLSHPLFALVAPEVVGISFIGVSLVGLVLFFIGRGSPGWTARNSGWDSWPKWTGEAVQGLGTFVAAWGTYRVVADQKPAWWFPVASALGAGFIWKLLLIYLEQQGKTADQDLASELDRAEREGRARTRLITTLGECVSGKIGRIKAELGKIGNIQRTINHARDALTPQPHLESLLISLLALLLEQARTQGHVNPSFRLGVYINAGGVMRPVHRASAGQPGHFLFTSHNTHQSFFQLGGEGPRSCVVACVRQRAMLIVENCQEAPDSASFVFFNQAQRSYLGSLLVYYLGQVQVGDGTMEEAAISIDTPQTGFFKESDRDAHEFCLREFGRRVCLEMCLVDLLRSGAG